MWDPFPLWCPLRVDNAISTCEVLNRGNGAFQILEVKCRTRFQLCPDSLEFGFKLLLLLGRYLCTWLCPLMLSAAWCTSKEIKQIKCSSYLFLQSPFWMPEWDFWCVRGNQGPPLSPPKSANDLAGSHLAPAGVLVGDFTNSNKKSSCSKVNCSEKIGLSLLAVLFFLVVLWSRKPAV